MDKETLSNYGWIVIAVLVLAVMIALATPFGSYIAQGFDSAKQGLFDTHDSALNIVGLTAKSPWVVPEGGQFTTADGSVYNAGDKVAGDYVCTMGDTYTYGDYEYKYKCSYNGTKWTNATNYKGWGVRCTNPDIEVASPVLDSILGEPLYTLNHTFKGCTKLKDISNFKIPNGVVYASGTFMGCTELTDASGLVFPESVIGIAYLFQNCTNLQTAPTIPENIKIVAFAFAGCTSLTGTIEINSTTPGGQYIQRVFYNVDMSKITLIGTCPHLEAIRNTGSFPSFQISCPPNGTMTVQYTGTTWAEFLNSESGQASGLSIVGGYVAIADTYDPNVAAYYITDGGTRLTGNDVIIKDYLYTRTWNG